MNAFIRFLYTLLIAAAVVTFIALGVYSFHQPPKYPAYPDYTYSDQSQYDKQQKDFNAKVDDYNKARKSYYHGVTYFALPSVVVVAMIGWLIRKRSNVISEGVLLGGVATGIYAVITASLGDSQIMRFIGVTVLLATVIFAAQHRFANSAE